MGQVLIVVDACQMRIGRARLRKYLDRGYLVIITGSKFFTGPPFSGALLVPAVLSKALDPATEVASGLRDYSSRSDWPVNWTALRSGFPIRTNFGQWLRWEAALEEIGAYYGVPDEFRRSALTMFGEGVERIIGSSPSLRMLRPQQKPESADDEEMAQATIFPFVIRHEDRDLSLAGCRNIYRAHARDAGNAACANAQRGDPIAAKVCLIGQPVALGGTGQHPVAVLRICAGARLVTEAWSSDPDTARENLQRELGRVGAIVSKLEWLLGHRDGVNLMEVSNEA